METREHTLPEHLRRELFDGPTAGGDRPGPRATLLGALIVALTLTGGAWAAGVSLPWPL